MTKGDWAKRPEELQARLLSDEVFQALLDVVYTDLVGTPEVLRSCVHGLHGGAIERAYADFDLLVRDPSQAADVARVFAYFIERVKATDDINLVAFVKKNDEESQNTVGAILLAGLICASDGAELPHVVVRLDSDILHQRIKLERGVGPLEQAMLGTRVVLVSDHSTRGRELIEAVDTLKAYGADVRCAVVLTRMKELFEQSQAMEEFRTRDVQFYYFWDILPPPEDRPTDPPRVVPNPAIWVGTQELAAVE